MKFNLANQDKQKLTRLIEQREFNIYMSDLINDFINSPNRYLKGVNPEDMFEEFYKRLDVDPEYEDYFKKHYFPNGIYKLDDALYKDNRYFKNVRIDNIKFQKYTLGLETYKPQEVFIADDFKIIDDDYYLELPKLGYFENVHKFLAIKENKVIWMSITPAETDTMIEHIKEMHGDIITFGLGLCYFQYMAALKDDVTTVTVVERDPNIIELFKTHILPNFGEVAKKIIIIHDDAYNQMTKFDKYDCVYVDLWHNPNDGIKFYWDFKKIEHLFPHTEFYYWLEDGIIALIRRCAITLIQEQFIDHLNDSYYVSGKDCEVTDLIINGLYKQLKNKEFNSYDEIFSLLSMTSLIELLKLI